MIYANEANYPQNIAESSTITVPSEVPMMFMSSLVIIISPMLSHPYVIDLTGYDLLIWELTLSLMDIAVSINDNSH